MQRTGVTRISRESVSQRRLSRRLNILVNAFGAHLNVQGLLLPFETISILILHVRFVSYGGLTDLSKQADVSSGRTHPYCHLGASPYIEPGCQLDAFADLDENSAFAIDYPSLQSVVSECEWKIVEPV